VHCLEVEEHIEDCEACAEFIEHMQRTRSSLRRATRTSAPSFLRERVSAMLVEARHEADLALDEDRSAEPVVESSPSTPGITTEDKDPEPDIGSVRPASTEAGLPSLVHLRYIVPLAAAATIALVFGAMQLRDQEMAVADTNEPIVTATASPTAIPVQEAAWSMLLDGLTQRHIQPPSLETFDPKGVEEYAPHIGVRVSSPHVKDAQWVGARLESNAALMRFIRQDRRPVTVFVFDPKRVHMCPTRQIHRRVINHESVLAGKLRGVAVAASEQDGVGYALATDASVEEAAQLILTTAR
jgi:hypothetical protein